MKKIILFGLIAVFLMASVGTAMAIGPKNAKGKNPNVTVIEEPYGTCTFLSTGDGGFHDWWEFNEGTLQYDEYGPKLHTVCKPITVEPDGEGWWEWCNDGYWPVPVGCYWCKQSKPSE